jgi:drug/metabolite transporter (DMT)-like permease
MTGVAIVLAFSSAVCFGLGLVLTQVGLRDLSPLAGAAVSIPSSTLLFVVLAPFTLAGTTPIWAALPIFVAVGLLYPGVVTLMTFEANRVLGPVITGALGNLAPLFAVAVAVIVLAEPLRPLQLAGILAIVAGVVVLPLRRNGESASWRSWYLLLPLLAAAMRGLIQPTIKLGLDIWPSAFAATLISYIMSSLVVITTARLRTGRFLAPAAGHGRAWFLAVGVCNGLAVLLMYAALANGPVALVSPLVATYPLVTATVGALVLGKAERGMHAVLGAALTVAGVVLLLVA